MNTTFVKSPKTRPVRSKAATNAIVLQDIAMADCQDPETPVHVRAALMRAWVDLQEMRLRLAMKPAPKPIDVSQVPKRRRRQAQVQDHDLPSYPDSPQPPSTPPVV